jgi:hypothetical protein
MLNRITGRDKMLGGGDSVSKHRALKENGYMRITLYECLNLILAAGMPNGSGGLIIHVV